MLASVIYLLISFLCYLYYPIMYKYIFDFTLSLTFLFISKHDVIA